MVQPRKGPSKSDVHAPDPSLKTEGLIGELGSLAAKQVETTPARQRRERREKLFVPPVKWFEATAALSRLSTARAALLWHLLRMQTKLDGQVWIVPRLSLLVEAGLGGNADDVRLGEHGHVRKSRSRAIKELERAGLIEVRRRRGKGPLLRLLPIVKNDS